MIVEVLVADREEDGAAWLIRRGAAQEVGAGFAKWLASPEQGRYLVMVSPAETMEEMFVNVATEAQLIEVIAETYLEHLQRHYAAADGSDFTFNLQHTVNAALEAKLHKMSDELLELVRQSRMQ